MQTPIYNYIFNGNDQYIQLKYSRWLNGHRKLSDSPCQIKETVMFSASIQNHRG